MQMENAASGVVAANCIRDDLFWGYGYMWSITCRRDHSSHRAVDNEGTCHSDSYRDALIRGLTRQDPCQEAPILLKSNVAVVPSGCDWLCSGCFWGRGYGALPEGM